MVTLLPSAFSVSFCYHKLRKTRQVSKERSIQRSTRAMCNEQKKLCKFSSTLFKWAHVHCIRACSSKSV